MSKAGLLEKLKECAADNCGQWDEESSDESYQVVQERCDAARIKLIAATPVKTAPPCEYCETLREALAAVRDLLVPLQKEVGYLPEQGGYSTTMTKPELQVYEAIKNLDIILRQTAIAPLKTYEDKDSQ